MSQSVQREFQFAASLQDSVVLVVDADLSDIEFAKGAAVLARFPSLCVVRTNFGSSANAADVIVRATPNPLREPAVVDAIKASNADRLIIMGEDIYGGVSSAALSGLELGYEVYLVDDATVFCGRNARKLFKDRFRMTGGVVVSAKHLTNELGESLADLAS